MIIIRFAEIGLKGRNRAFFEKTLVNNIKSCLDAHKIIYKNIKRPMGRVLIATDDSCKCLECVFGIASFSDAVNAGFNMESVKKEALKLAKDLTPKKSFRITCQRLDKRFPMTSQEFDVELGAFIQEKTNAKVKMKGFDLNIRAEIIDNFVYLFTEKIKGLGGLPVGVEGKVIVLLENEASLLAGLFMMKRGCHIIPAAFKEMDISLLQKYAFGTRVELKIIKNISDIDALAKEHKAKAVAVSDLLDTMKEYDMNTKVFRPLIAYEPKEIAEELNGFRQRVC
ncbi:hypothetical protein KY346_02940 [Candidatus Woesearchaeota archaeon]|nr:hypothetical protein [Candidatus Woesearchaeota archaeon]